ncbi:MAG: nitrilase-related carbon-nitrogen hydrolase [Nitrospirota bacterium]
MKAAFFQFSPVFGEKEKNFKKVVSAVRGAELDLVVLPEFFATGYQFVSSEEVAALAEPVPAGPTTDILSELSREKGIYIAAGLPEKAGDKYYNSAVLTGPEGFIGVYRKTHLFFEEMQYFTPGDTGFKVWNTDIGRIGIMICFDWFYPESMRSLALLGVEVVAHPSNLVLPFCPDAMPVRCLENMVFAVTANRIGTESRKQDQSLTFIGKSEIVSPKGEILIRAPEDREVLMVNEIDPMLARDKSLNPYNSIFNDRRPDKYRML